MMAKNLTKKIVLYIIYLNSTGEKWLMAKLGVAVLDFGSSKLTLLVGHRSINENFAITASSDIDYAGFMDSEFLEPEELSSSIGQVVNEIKEILKRPITKLYVGVPGEFCKVERGTLSKKFSKKVRITDKILEKLYFNADENINCSTHTVINISPINYVLDDTNTTFSPVDSYCNKIEADICYVLADNEFISRVSGILKKLGIQDVEFMSSTLAQSEYLFTSEVKHQGALFVDCGYLTTNVVYFKGEGITNLDSFSMGGGQITAELSEKLNLPFAVAEQVKQKLLITLKPTGIDYYEVYKNNRREKIQMLPANEIAISVIDDIIENIKNIIDNYEELPQDFETLYLTGGGLSYLKGIKYYIGRELGRNVEIICPKPLKFKKPDVSSVISVLDTALGMREERRY